MTRSRAAAAALVLWLGVSGCNTCALCDGGGKSDTATSNYSPDLPPATVSGPADGN